MQLRAKARCAAMLVGLVVSHATWANVNPSGAFATAVALMEAGNFEEAIPILDRLADEHPVENVFWNLGIASAATGDFEKAMGAWLAVRNSSPDNWHVYAKLVQTHQALGNLKDRDAERNSLIHLWKSANNAELSAQERFCREQFKLNRRHVFAFEHFAPHGERREIYSFVIPPHGSDEGVTISLGSRQSTNQIAWELGEMEPDSRLYHLDLYKSDLHETHRFYKYMPTYEEVRAHAVEVLQGSRLVSIIRPTARPSDQ